MANTGIKNVLTLRKYVNGVATSEVKNNTVGDPDYIAPYEDLVACPISSTTTTTTTTTVALNTTTTTTTQAVFQNQSLSANCSSSTGGSYTENNISYTINATRDFNIPSNGNFNIVLTANFTTGPSTVSCFSRVDKLDNTITLAQGPVSASTGAPVDTDSNLNVALTAGDYRMFIYGADCDSSFGSFNLAVTQV